MKNLLNKEFRLALHPTNLIFIMLSAMVLIPNYPYMIIFFYTTLGIFFLCLSGRENHDLAYSVSLPVPKSDVVKSRILSVCLIEILQAVTALPFMAVRLLYPESMKNSVGIEANVAFLGLSFVMLGFFNYFFFTSYFRNPEAVGKSFLKGSIAEFLFMLLAEVSVHVVPYMAEVIDTRDPQNLAPKMLFLLIGLLIFALLNLAACKKSVRSFEILDL